MSEVVTPRLWVGCLACYNGGLLLGEWFDADEAPTSEREFNDAVGVPRSHTHDVTPHEEIWVFDHEGIPVRGEFSPQQGQEYAGWLEALNDGEYDAFEAYLKHSDEPFNEDSVADFQERYRGEWSSDASFTEDYFYETRDGSVDLEWPFTCIDWEWASRDLMQDFYSVDGHYFYAN